jgi:anti-sigma B factor antagonist
VITLPAEIDIVNSDQVYQALARALRGGAAVLVADATGTTFCDCAGARALARAHHQAAAAGAQLRVAASPALRRILDLADTGHLLNTHPTVAAALDGERPENGRLGLNGHGIPRRMTQDGQGARAIVLPGGEQSPAANRDRQ